MHGITRTVILILLIVLPAVCCGLFPSLFKDTMRFAIVKQNSQNYSQLLRAILRACGCCGYSDSWKRFAAASVEVYPLESDVCGLLRAAAGCGCGLRAAAGCGCGLLLGCG